MPETVVITGGSAGIGRATARAFARRGDNVAIIARGQDRLDATRAELEGMGVRVHTVSADVADADAVAAAAVAIVAALGPITIWVNNAMATVYSPIAEMTADEIRRVTEVTYLGSVHGTLTALKHMQRGTIVQVSSVLAWRALPIQGAYCGAKFALRGFTEALRSELIHDRSPLHLTMVHLPAVNTPQFDWARNKTGHQTNAPSPYAPEVAADAILFATTHRRRDVYVGASTPPTILAARLAPSVLDRALATKGYTAQLTDVAVPYSDGNLFTPVPGNQAAEGRFTAQSNQKRDISTSRQGDVLALAVLTLGAVTLGMLARSPLTVGPALAARAVLRRL